MKRQLQFLLVLGCVGVAMAGCADAKTSGSGSADVSNNGDANLAVAIPRIVDGVDLCGVLNRDEFSAVVGAPIISGPGKNPVTKGCSFATQQSEVDIEVARQATGKRVAVADHSAFVDVPEQTCRVAVAVMPGSTQDFGSFLQVSSKITNANDNTRCKQSSAIARAILAKLPRG